MNTVLIISAILALFMFVSAIITAAVALLSIDSTKELVNRHLLATSGTLFVIGAVLCMMIRLVSAAISITMIIAATVVYGWLFWYDSRYRADRAQVSEQRPSFTDDSQRKERYE